MPELRVPTPRLHASWLESLQEWGRGVHQDGAAVHPDTDHDDPEAFAAWVEQLLLQADPTTERPSGYVPATNRWIVEDDTYLGAIQLRHTLNPHLLEVGGHIGYGIRPSARGRGLATWALREVLDLARRLDLDSVLLTCDDTNLASAAVIERNGGELEDVREHAPGERVRRYWIAL
ncbi:GNAT family N-acetyltransferase [Arsenicicoccus dermatophilus]|uniref:GNAT family N-acetyltransferase n=1 Tax=Arsenicicoccus dermatophilus TaxID=1076331 RepID=UPI003916F7DA